MQKRQLKKVCLRHTFLVVFFLYILFFCFQKQLHFYLLKCSSLSLSLSLSLYSSNGFSIRVLFHVFLLFVFSRSPKVRPLQLILKLDFLILADTRPAPTFFYIINTLYCCFYFTSTFYFFQHFFAKFYNSYNNLMLEVWG
jgi:hypothetical protein